MTFTNHELFAASLNRFAAANAGSPSCGVLDTIGLAWLRTRFTWWPFHPVGYALANSFELDLLWCQYFVGWICKVATLRYGGMNAYRGALPDGDSDVREHERPVEAARRAPRHDQRRAARHRAAVVAEPPPRLRSDAPLPVPALLPDALPERRGVFAGCAPRG